MPTSFVFGGNSISEPGVYVDIKSGITQPSVNLDYGQLVFIDTGSCAGWGGAGINSELSSSEDNIIEFASIQAVKNYFRGGLMWKLCEMLFQPNGFGSSGISRLTVIKAATTTAPNLSLALTNGTIELKCKHEGVGSNGVLTNQELTRGFGLKIEAGILDPSKYIFKFFRGNYAGPNDDGSPFDGLPESETNALLLVQSIEVSTLEEFVTWTTTSGTFQVYFEVVDNTIEGAITATDLSDNAGFIVATGGTEVYNSTDYDDALEQIIDLEFSLILSDQYGANSNGGDNFKLLAALTTESTYKKLLFIGGGADSGTFQSQSIAAAESYDSDLVHVIHGDILKFDPTITSTRRYSSLYHAALIVGRTGGLTPQTPLTFKLIGIDGEIHKLKSVERVLALQKGVLHTRFNGALGGYVINQGINTLQQNTNFVNVDGRSHSVQITRIVAQLIRELVFNAQVDLFGNQEIGPNRANLTTADVRSWTNGFLQRRTATDTADNLIINHQDIVVTIEQDAFFIRFDFQANYEVNKMFFVGFLLQ